MLAQVGSHGKQKNFRRAGRSLTISDRDKARMHDLAVRNQKDGILFRGGSERPSDSLPLAGDVTTGQSRFNPAYSTLLRTVSSYGKS